MLKAGSFEAEKSETHHLELNERIVGVKYQYTLNNKQLINL